MIAARIGAIARARPDAIAIEDGDASITYRALWAWSGAIAARLAGRGIGREDVVALRLGRSAEHVVAMLGVWRAGAAFLPLDPRAPAEREAWISGQAAVTITLGSDDLRSARGDDATFDAAPGPDDLAYVIATSGSTGRPKCVEVLHRGILPVLDAQREAFAIDERARVLWMLSPAFDASISDIGTALLSGATLVIAPPGLAIEDALESRAITHVDLPPALLPLLSRAPATLRTIVIGGEACPVDAVRAWATRVRLVNVYGPTEATICTSLGVCDASWDRALIGAPLPHVRYRVVDGELWIAGDALARGYRNQPALTADRFVVHDGERWYRTHDRVRACADDEHEYVGRIDRQIKRHGRLVEPAEIESALAGDPAVARAAVVVHARAGLVAFVVAREDVRGDEIRARLATKLPGWMIPARVELVAMLPETSSGKIDLTSLTSRALVHTPGGDPDDVFARIWSEILGVTVGADDDVAALGADSLAILRFAITAEARGIPLSLCDVAAARTPGDLRTRAAPNAMTAEALREDAATFVRSTTPTPFGPMRAAAPRVIAITGATGLLGRRFVARLREHAPHARIITLDRPRCDLTRPRLGLAPRDWDELADVTDTIVHLGARVNMLASYAALREPNVAGTARVIELATAARPKTLHHVSTLSVFVATDRDHGVAYEDDDLSTTARVHGGYAQSKFAAELVARRAAPELGALRIHRFGLLTGDRTDFLSTFVRGVAGLGALPIEADLALAVDITPLDFAADALARLVVHEEPAPVATYHLANAAPASLRDLIEAMTDEGITIARVAESSLRATNDEEAAALVALCRGRSRFDRHRTMDLFEATGIRFDDRRTREALGDGCPPADRALLRRYVREALS